jgi:phosphoserine aminotransferase
MKDLRIHNFSSGPAQLPLDVLKRAQKEYLSFQGKGFNIGEISHRSTLFDSILESAKDRLAALLDFSRDDFHILFLQGGATAQFAQIPMNFSNAGKNIGLLNTGVWSKKMLSYLKQAGPVVELYNGSEYQFSELPDSNWEPTESFDWVHFTSNNTIYGTQFHTEPKVGSALLVCDASSDILSKPINMDKYGMIYAGAQKNLGPAGVTIVIIRKSFLAQMHNNSSTLPAYFNYNSHTADLFNTPPTYAIYLTDLVLEWLQNLGGLSSIKVLNEKKAGLLFECLDSSDFYKGHAVKKDRSLMNVSFIIDRDNREELEKAFIYEAEALGMIGLKGHRSLGGIRASIYNACPQESVEQLITFMQEFEKKRK